MVVRKGSAAAAGVVVLALGALFYRLAAAPVHGVSSAADCIERYAKAKTHEDTTSVDFTSYPDSAGRGVRQRCYATRTRLQSTGTPLSSSPPRP